MSARIFYQKSWSAVKSFRMGLKHEPETYGIEKILSL